MRVDGIRGAFIDRLERAREEGRERPGTIKVTFRPVVAAVMR